MSDSQPAYGMDLTNMPSQELQDLQTAQAQGMIQSAAPQQAMMSALGGNAAMGMGQISNPSDVFDHNRTFEHALFKLNSTELTDQAKRALDEIIHEIQRVEAKIGRPIAVTVVGHTDATGSEDRNIDLSLRRAYAARGYLHTRGITADRVNIDGRGSTEPLVPNKDGKPEPANRRVDVYMHD
jgi:outer membrane protein OmpA-like peptidoglycan-associated protein